MGQFFQVLDGQMSRYKDRLVRDLRLSPEAATTLATTIDEELRSADQALLRELEKSSPLSIEQRLEWFSLYQVWKNDIDPRIEIPSDVDLSHVHLQNALMVMRARVHLYMSFVFAGDGLFQVLARRGRQGSALRACARYIRKNPLRALRNAVAHGNWELTTDGSVKYWARKGQDDSAWRDCWKWLRKHWARKGQDDSEAMSEFVASEEDVHFYVALSRCVAWASLSSFHEVLRKAEGHWQN